MRTASRAIVVSALALPLVFAGGGIGFAQSADLGADLTGTGSLSTAPLTDSDSAGTVWNDQDHTSALNFGIIG